ncbi:hypothetical protein M902_2191 [Bacteriovorax sp. BAL6_X]|uniref:hypothetical protein n=1 Tax=Bacteriovorax sp. BAL6_X TaxID=1201290 RepID=UPI000385FA19|nr:hypothetical protein [Bacteriovorax sp. BAL6_X]EPZ52185.1 hypothetical protein M902_2191 [Bacteriovorax sp. BAL6_X]
MVGNKPQDAAAKSVETGFSENELDDIMAEFASLDKELTGQLDQVPVEEVVAEVNPLDEMMAEANPLDEMVAEVSPVDESEEGPAQIVAQEDIEEVVAGDSNPTLEEVFSEGFDEEEMDAIMRDLEEIDATSPETTLEMEETAETTMIKDEDNENVLVINQAHKETPAPAFTQVPTGADSGEVAFSAAGNMNFNVNLTIAGSQATLSVVDGHFTLTMNGVDVSITEEGFKACIEGGANFNIPLPSADEAKKVA